MNKKYILVIILSSFLQFACSSKVSHDDISCLQLIDRNGLSEIISSEEKLSKYKNVDFDRPQSYQKVLRIYNKDKDGNILSKLTSYHDNGQISKYLEIKNARAYGDYKEWHLNGNIKVEAFVIGGSADFNMKDVWLFDGKCKAFDEKGNLISEFNYVKGHLQGQAFHYYPSNEIRKIVPYLNNEIDGELLKYSKRGILILKENYKNGIKDGQAVGFWASGNICFIEDYEKGLIINAQYFKKNRVKVATIKNKEGQKAIFKDSNLFQLIEYKNGIPEGKVQTFTADGELINEYFKKKGIKDGEEIQYYKKNELEKTFKSRDPFPKLEICWDKGKIHGTVKTWYKNGKLESQKEYSQNKKIGSHFAWYETGSVMFVEEYEDEKLTKGSYYQMNHKDAISTVINGNGTATLFDSKGRFIKKIEYKDGQPNK